LIQKEVVLVTFNYRMGVFGFLSLDNPSLNIPGNAAFKDQRFALQWINRNIKNFGGDANNVTLFGESSGGGSAHYHMLSENSRDLFHKGIIMSGSALNPIYSTIPRNNWAKRLCQKLNFTGYLLNESHILEFFENANPQAAIKATGTLMNDEERSDKLVIAFGPTIEPYKTPESFLTRLIIELMRNHPWGNKIDILIGNCSFELSSFLPIQLLKDFNSFVPKDLKLAVDSPKRAEYAKVLKSMYYGMLEPSLTNIDGCLYVSNRPTCH